MTEDHRAKKQTQMLAPLGLITSGELSGQPIFQYKRASVYMVDRRKPSTLSQSASGLWVPSAQEWERVPQFSANDNRWSIGKWLPPSYTQEEWIRRFNFLLDYPRNGWWWLYLPLEYLPDEEWTSWFLQRTLDQMGSTVKSQMDDITEHNERRIQANNRAISDMIPPVLLHVPGKRGGSYSVPKTRFDR